ncbi:hypothetical protein GCM10027289_05490 [Tsukamurella serpentis]
MLLASVLFGTTACIQEQPTMRAADLQEVRSMTEAWTGVPLPEQMTLVAGSYLSAFLDPSVSATFDARSSDVDRFVDGLGTRVQREYAPDCSDLSNPVRFSGAGSAVPGEVVIEFGWAEYLASLVKQGSIERCRNVVVVHASPRGVQVEMSIQAGPTGSSRVILSVVTT